ncbi:hypothetical protein ACQPX6_16970 [Actinomycetospora sp. CA-101289]|uniref:hypothetical protein n=1 Tax=Actinomycetospora sp. CA-101289 TaxID=3239893 RepID=UPI003D96A040
MFRDAEAAVPVATVVEAAVLLCRHLLSDVVTPTSLPLPGSSLLDELFGVTGRDLNRLLYQGERGKITGLGVLVGVLRALNRQPRLDLVLASPATVPEENGCRRRETSS